jgi:hypothetical protein
MALKLAAGLLVVASCILVTQALPISSSLDQQPRPLDAVNMDFGELRN